MVSTLRSRNHDVTIALLLASLMFPTEAFAVPSLKGGNRGPTIDRQRVVESRFRLFSSPETAADTTPPFKSSVVPKKSGVNGASPRQSKFPSRFSINVSNAIGRIRQVSNFASFLCVLDCTILPIITVALPLLGVLNLGSSQLEALHELGHSLALYFVLPVGSLTTIMNYLSHRKNWIAFMALSGLTLVGLANSHFHLSGSPQWIGNALHMIQHCGPWHRVVNISGCALLLGSNYLSQQQGCAHHDHSHSASYTTTSPTAHSHDHHDHDH